MHQGYKCEGLEKAINQNKMHNGKHNTPKTGAIKGTPEHEVVYTSDEDSRVVAMNKADTPRSEWVPMAGLADDGTVLSDALQWERGVVIEDGGLALELGPWDTALFLP